MDKSPDAFRTISEVAEILETPAHVLRFWESRFPQIKPVKRTGGRRYYRPVDLALLMGIRRLLHDEGMTIRGVQKILREQGVRHVSGLTEEEENAANEADFAEDVAPIDEAPSDPIPLFPTAFPTAPVANVIADDVPDHFVPSDTLMASDPVAPDLVEDGPFADADIPPAAQDAENGPFESPPHEAEFGEHDPANASAIVGDTAEMDDPSDALPQWPLDAQQSEAAQGLTEEHAPDLVFEDGLAVADDEAGRESVTESALPEIAAEVEVETAAASPKTALRDRAFDPMPELPFDPPISPARHRATGAEFAPILEDIPAAETPVSHVEVTIEETPAEDITPDMADLAEPFGGDDDDSAANLWAEPDPVDGDMTGFETVGIAHPEMEAAAPEAPEIESADVAADAAPEEAITLAAETEPDPAEQQQAEPLPAFPPKLVETPGHWLATDLRGLRRGALWVKRDQALPIFQRLEALRNRVGDLGRVPRR